MDYKTILFEVREGVGHLTLNRADAANSINLELAQELFPGFHGLLDPALILRIAFDMLAEIPVRSQLAPAGDRDRFALLDRMTDPQKPFGIEEQRSADMWCSDTNHLQFYRAVTCLAVAFPG